jgi:transposase
MQTVTIIGFDIAKSVFQVHGVDTAGQVVIRRQLKRRGEAQASMPTRASVTNNPSRLRHKRDRAGHPA